jgi:hypothetical protein
MPYRLHSSSGPETDTNYIYGYAISLTNTKTVSSLTLPSSGHVFVFAIDLVP